MAELTEAEALLQSGAMYPRRTGLRDPGGSIILVGVKHGGFSVYFGDGPFYHFDLDGRWQRLLLDGTHYLKGLDTHVHVIGRVREDPNLVLHRSRLREEETAVLDSDVVHMARHLICGLTDGSLELLAPAAPACMIEHADLRDLLRLILHWDADRFVIQRQEHEALYEAPGFLPPDCQQSFTLQAVLRRGKPELFGASEPIEGRPRELDEFRCHGRQVRRLLGSRLAQCRNVYLGGAGVFRQAPERILEYLQATTELFRLTDDERPLRPVWLRETERHIESVHGFLCDFRPPLPTIDDWKRFQAVHLRRMTLGIESGCFDLRQEHGETWENDHLIRAVEEMKQSGLAITLAVLVGTGGAVAQDRHLEGTADLLTQLPLAAQDRIFLIDAEEVGRESFRRRLAAQGRTLALSEQLEFERQGLKRAWKAAYPMSRTKILDYTMAKQRMEPASQGK